MAYAATVVLVLLTAVPGAPLKRVPGKALEIVQAGPMSTPLIGPALDATSGWVGSRTSGAAWPSARTGVNRRLEQTGSFFDRARRPHRDRPARQLGTHLKGMVSKVGDGQLGEAGYEFLAALKAGQLDLDRMVE